MDYVRNTYANFISLHTYKLDIRFIVLKRKEKRKRENGT